MKRKVKPASERGSPRGDYRAIHTVLLDSPEFIDMSPEAQLVFFHLKLRLGPTGIDVLPAAEAMLSEATHYDLTTVRGALSELAGEWDAVSHPVSHLVSRPVSHPVSHPQSHAAPIADGSVDILADAGAVSPANPRPASISDGIPHPMRMGWLHRERQVFWLRNALKFEPSRSLLNENHRKNIADHLAGLPKLKIVNDFADYYGLPKPFPGVSHPPSHPPSHPKGIPDHGVTEERSNGRTETESSARAEEIFADLDDLAVKSIQGLYGWDGHEGTDERVWNGTAAPDRVRCLSIAIDRLRGEGRTYNGKFFRRILVSVIEEQAARPTTSVGPSGALRRPSVFDLPEASGA